MKSILVLFWRQLLIFRQKTWILLTIMLKRVEKRTQSLLVLVFFDGILAGTVRCSACKKRQRIFRNRISLCFPHYSLQYFKLLQASPGWDRHSWTTCWACGTNCANPDGTSEEKEAGRDPQPGNRTSHHYLRQSEEGRGRPRKGSGENGVSFSKYVLACWVGKKVEMGLM